MLIWLYWKIVWTGEYGWNRDIKATVLKNQESPPNLFLNHMKPETRILFCLAPKQDSVDCQTINFEFCLPLFSKFVKWSWIIKFKRYANSSAIFKGILFYFEMIRSFCQVGNINCHSKTQNAVTANICGWLCNLWGI